MVLFYISTLFPSFPRSLYLSFFGVYIHSILFYFIFPFIFPLPFSLNRFFLLFHLQNLKKWHSNQPILRVLKLLMHILMPGKCGRCFSAGLLNSVIFAGSKNAFAAKMLSGFGLFLLTKKCVSSAFTIQLFDDEEWWNLNKIIYTSMPLIFTHTHGKP